MAIRISQGAAVTLDVANVVRRLREVDLDVAARAVETGERAIARAIRDRARRTTLFRDETGYLRESIRVRQTLAGPFRGRRRRVRNAAGSVRVRRAWVQAGDPVLAAQAYLIHEGWRPRGKGPRTRRRPFLDEAADAVAPEAQRIMATSVRRSLDRQARKAERDRRAAVGLT